MSLTRVNSIINLLLQPQHAELSQPQTLYQEPFDSINTVELLYRSFMAHAITIVGLLQVYVVVTDVMLHHCDKTSRTKAQLVAHVNDKIDFTT